MKKNPKQGWTIHYSNVSGLFRAQVKTSAGGWRCVHIPKPHGLTRLGAEKWIRRNLERLKSEVLLKPRYVKRDPMNELNALQKRMEFLELQLTRFIDEEQSRKGRRSA